MEATNTENHSSDEESTRTLKDRLEEMPTYNIAASGLSSFYNSVKGTGYFAGAFSAGESVAASLSNAAVATANVAANLAKPVVGEIKDPVGAIDNCAAEVLAKVQEKLPVVKQDPRDYVEAAKTSAKDKANYYYERVQGMSITQNAVRHLDNAVAVSDIVVELVLPTDLTNEEDILGLEKEEDEANHTVAGHATLVGEKAYRRGKRKLLSYKAVQTSVGLVQFAQNQISETTRKLLKGSNYTGTGTPQQPTATADGQPTAQIDEHNLGAELAAEGWETVHKSTMFIPDKALEVSGEIYVSAKELIFSYTDVNELKEMPSKVTQHAATYYKSVLENETVKDIKDKATAFAYAPKHVIDKYIQSNRVVQWILPQRIRTESIQVINDEN